MKYIFKQIDDISGHNAETTVEFNADSLPDILEHFEMFIRGSGFHPTGILDFVDEEDEYTTPKFEPAEEDYEEEEESGADPSWPFPLTRPTEAVQQESIYDGDLNSPSAGSGPAIMDWTAAQLIRPPKMEDVCPICKIDMQTMSNHECWDSNCPKGKDAN
jgi:hypothetical protein